MKELVIKSQKGNPATTSLLVAEKFGKEHKDVLESIRTIVRTAENSALLEMFHEARYKTSQNKLMPMFYMNRDGFSLLVMGFTGEKALQFKIEFIDAFNKMEAALKQQFQIPQTYAEALHLAADQAQQIEEQQMQLQEAKPKVLFADAVTASKECILVRELAVILTQKGFKIGQNRLYTRLREEGYLCKKGESYNRPTQMAIEKGLFEIKKTSLNQPDGTIFISETTKVTPKGQIYFINKYLTAA